jgi:hypothetical protein
MKRPLKTLVFVLLAGSALGLPARADDVPPVVSLMLKNWETQFKIKPTYDSIKNDGNGNITIQNLQINKDGTGDGPGFKGSVAEVDLKGVADKGDGLYEIASADFNGVKADIAGKDGQGIAIDAPQAHVEGWYFKQAGDNPTPLDTLRANMNVARKMTSGKVTVTAVGQTFVADGYQSSWDGDPATGAGTFSFNSGNVNVPASALALVDTQGVLKQLGYGDLNFSLSGDGKLDIDNDKLGLTMNLAYGAKDMGTIKMSVGAGDVPVAAYAELRKAQLEGREPDFAAVMPQLQGSTISALSLRFEDASITNKILPMIAAMQGTTKDAFVANAGAMAQMGLMSLNNQEFTTKVVTAINSFLKDPKSITVAMKPAQPLKVQELMTLNPANPGEAITKLGVDVSAND